MYSIGCDQHKKYSFVVTNDENGNTLDQVKLYHTDKERMKNYFSSLPKGSVVALESCGFDPWLGDMLEELGMIVKLAHTAKTKAIAENHIKTDKISVNVLADLLRTNLLPEAYRPPRRVRDSRQLLRYRLRLISLRSSLKNNIHTILALHGIQQPFSDLFGSKGRDFLDQLPLSEPYCSIVNNYLSLIDDLTERINKVDALLRRKLKSNLQAQLLNTIPGSAEGCKVFPF